MQSVLLGLAPVVLQLKVAFSLRNWSSADWSWVWKSEMKGLDVLLLVCGSLACAFFLPRVMEDVP